MRGRIGGRGLATHLKFCHVQVQGVHPEAGANVRGAYFVDKGVLISKSATKGDRGTLYLSRGPLKKINRVLRLTGGSESFSMQVVQGGGKRNCLTILTTCLTIL